MKNLIKVLVVSLLCATMQFAYVGCSNGNANSGATNNGGGSSNNQQAHTHKYTVQNTKSATCTEEGYNVYKCTCGDSYKKAISALGHMYDSNTVKATCTEDGYVEYMCKTCGDSYRQTTNAIGHTYTTNTVRETCTEDGYTEYKCKTCGYSYVGDNVSALGHNVVNGKCTRCDYTELSKSEQLKNFILTYGIKDETKYEITKQVESEGYVFTTVLSYDTETGKIGLYEIAEYSSSSYGILFDLDKISSVYNFYYVNNTGSTTATTAKGTFTGALVKSYSHLTFTSYSSIFGTRLKDSDSKVAASLLRSACTTFNLIMLGTGITIADWGIIAS